MSFSISAFDSVVGSPESSAVSTASLTLECSTAAAPSGAATGSAGVTVTTAGSAGGGATAAGGSCVWAAACSVSTFVVCSGAAVAAVAVCPAERSTPGFSLSENILLPPVRSLPRSQQETLGLSSESRGGARKEARLPTQVPHRGDDTRALWPMSMKREVDLPHFLAFAAEQ